MSSQPLQNRGETARFYGFGPFRIDVANRFLLRDGNPLPLSIKAFDLLLALVKRHGDVVGKDELMREVWADSFVEEGNLSHHVSMLRKQMGDDEHDHPYIETVPRRGYRFAASVRESDEETPAFELPAATPRGRRRTIWISSAGAAVLIIAAAVAVRFPRQTKEGANAPIQSIAVLPFQSSDEYTGSGLADVVAMRLSSRTGLIVRPTQTVIQSVDQKGDVAAAGRRLLVDAVVDGRVERIGSRLRATVKLVRSRNAAVVWSEEFNEDGRTPFVLEDAIAAGISSVTAARQDAGTNGRMAGSTSDPEAYRQYVIGRYYLAQQSRERAKALGYFKRAVDIDPRFGHAYAAIAETWCLLGVSGLVKTEEWVPQAEQAAIHALQLDGNLSEAQSALGSVRIYGNWDWKAGESGFRRALQLDRGNLLALRQLAHCLQLTGRFNEAIAVRKRASELDPLSMVVRREAGLTYYMARRYDDAIREHETVLAMSPTFELALINIGNACVQKGQTAKGIEYLERAVAAGDVARPNSMAWLANAYSRAGRALDAARVRNDLAKLAGSEFVQPYVLAVATLGSGDTDRVFVLLEQCYRTRAIGLMNLKTEPAWDPIRSDRRFADLLHRMALDQ